MQVGLDVQQLRVMEGQRFLIVAAGPDRPNSPITQFSPSLIQNWCMFWFEKTLLFHLKYQGYWVHEKGIVLLFHMSIESYI